MAEFKNHGIRFSYPEDWEIVDEHNGQAQTVTVSSPETSFWCVSIFDQPEPANSVLLAAIQAYQEEYDDVDASPVELEEPESELLKQAVAWDVDFECLELLNTVKLRAIETAERTILVLYQGTDHELEATMSLMDRMTESLMLVDLGN